MPLNDTQIRKFKSTDKAHRHADGGGLFLEVRPTGSKLWRLAYRFDGKQKLMALGSYPEVTLAKARERRLAARTLLADGVDPMVRSKEEKARARSVNENTFGRIATELLKKHEKDGLAERTLTKKRWLLGLAEQELGTRPVAEISAADVLGVLRKVEAKGNYESAKRMRSVIGQVFRYAIATARAIDDPTYALRGALVKTQVTHLAALTDWESYRELVRAIWQYEGGTPETRSALKLMVLLYPRPGELRQARWDEFDLQAGVWTIPKERMKMRREHVKPLAPHAIEILKELRALNLESDLVFPSAWVQGKPISENTLNTALRRMGFTKEECTSHGFRASASSLLNESGKWSPDAIEAELAHMGKDEVRRAYHRSKYWGERVRMADWWGKEIVEIAG
ncbi:integrase arm-type DNA-binding domain-containing protein [Parvularcula sp. IMCC14364]|uniref:tyrosine-type recombinase/integrase n=1 Tax=Parvularcula sp. IMCC14364 TaxID=3067902 RepID=UPI002740994A|nr:integrase arm-type DNA-binding domain-containing protein [Parvularcula sp. IMCC14364]